MYRPVSVCFLLIFCWSCLIAAGCGSQPAPGEGPQKPPFDGAQPGREKDFNFYYPQGWVLLERETVQESVTLRLQPEGSSAAQVIISYFPDAGCSEDEAVREAENLLRVGLFNIKEELSLKRETIGDRTVPFIYTRSGEKEIKLVQTAVITGEKGFLLATLVAREGAEIDFTTSFRLILENIHVE